MKTKYIFAIFCIFVLVFSSASVYAWQTHEEINSKADSELKTINPLSADGIFSAEVGMKDEEPFLYLDGNYHVKVKIIYCDGTAKMKDKEGGFIECKFYGIFKGEYFSLKIIFDEKDKPFVIEGGYKLADNGQDFQGVCIKGKDKKVEWGWIKGTFKGITNQPTLTEGIFTAKLGKRGNERPIVVLNGSYHTRNRYFIVKGTAEIGENSGRFRGMFRGNRFVIRIPIRGMMNTIIGQCRFDNRHQEFTGIWMGRGIPFRGWITGTFIPIS
jgi:hypothetical protein